MSELPDCPCPECVYDRVRDEADRAADAVERLKAPIDWAEELRRPFVGGLSNAFYHETGTRQFPPRLIKPRPA